MPDPRRLERAVRHSLGERRDEEMLQLVGAEPCVASVRVGLRLAGDDPRVALRETPATGDELTTLRAALARLDRAAPEPWTRRVLQAVSDHEELVARELAPLVGMERDLFKRRVRRLKDLGLTISLDVGYRVSPRGRAFLDQA